MDADSLMQGALPLEVERLTPCDKFWVDGTDQFPILTGCSLKQGHGSPCLFDIPLCGEDGCRVPLGEPHEHP
jgi:hypothetical protein